MALSTLSGDEQGSILGQLCSTLERRASAPAMYFSGASSDLYYGLRLYPLHSDLRGPAGASDPAPRRWAVAGAGPVRQHS